MSLDQPVLVGIKDELEEKCDEEERNLDLEAEALAILYAGHEIKDEMVLGPEGVQLPDAAFALQAKFNALDTDQDHVKNVFRSEVTPDVHQEDGCKAQGTKTCSVALDEINTSHEPVIMVPDSPKELIMRLPHGTQKEFQPCFVLLDRIIINEPSTHNIQRILNNGSGVTITTLFHMEVNQIPKIKSEIKQKIPEKLMTLANRMQKQFLPCFVKLDRIIMNEISTQNNEEILNKGSNITDTTSLNMEVNPIAETNSEGKQRNCKKSEIWANSSHKEFLPCFVKLDKCIINKSFTHNTQKILQNESSNMDFNQKVGTNSKISVYPCEICGKQLKYKHTLTKHIQVVHSTSTPYECDICNKHFKQSQTLKAHKIIHMKIKPFSCGICMKQFAQRSHRTAHYAIHHVQKAYGCDKCGQRFRTEPQLARHMQHETRKERVYICNYCEKQFNDRGGLIIHLRIHTGIKPYKCKTCNKQFSDQSALKRHELYHTGLKPYSCHICGLKVVLLATLKFHIQRHGVKRFSCDACGKLFAEKSYLIKHLRVHTGEKPYCCTFCSKRFSDSGSAAKHRRIHTGERPFKCGVCGKGFTRNQHLTSHSRTHTGEKPFACRTCDSRFVCKWNLRTHEKRNAKCRRILEVETQVPNLKQDTCGGV